VQLRLKELPAWQQAPRLAPRIVLTHGSVALRRQRYTEAQKWLRTFIDRYPQHDRIAEAHYLLARVYHHQHRADSSTEHYDYVIRHHSHSQWAAKSLLALAKLAEKADDFSKAAALYQRMAADFLTHEDAAESLWRAAWLYYQERDYPRAQQLWQHFEDTFPNDDLLPRAIYWQARIALQQRQQPKAIMLYQHIVRHYPFHYYSFLAHTQLQHAGAVVPSMTIPHETTIDWELRSPLTLPAASTTALTPPQFHLLRVREFQQLHMPTEARHEIRRLQTLLPDTHATRYFLATLYSANAHHLDTFLQLNQIVNTLHPDTLRGLSRDFWTMLYPKPFWKHVKEYAAANGLNPYLVLSIMRQESAFNPRARSYAGARGLMQLMPTTARQVSRALELPRFQQAMLFRPASNIALGTRYIATQLKRYNGNRVLALAAYNAGPHRAYRWYKKWAHLPLDEFIEHIPFRETRLYVKLILRNMMAYEYLYPDLQES
jgi:soluble lytic murein transglycosylase